MIKPDVVLYEEGLDSDVINKSVKAISEADTLIIGGTSLIVYPAAGDDHSAVKLSIEELEQISGAEGWVDVCKE